MQNLAEARTSFPQLFARRLNHAFHLPIRIAWMMDRDEVRFAVARYELLRGNVDGGGQAFLIGRFEIPRPEAPHEASALVVHRAVLRMNDLEERLVAELAGAPVVDEPCAAHVTGFVRNELSNAEYDNTECDEPEPVADFFHDALRSV